MHDVYLLICSCIVVVVIVIVIVMDQHRPGFVSLLEVRASQQHQGVYHMAPAQCFEEKAHEDSHFNSLAYNSYHSHLAAATEKGAHYMYM